MVGNYPLVGNDGENLGRHPPAWILLTGVQDGGPISAPGAVVGDRVVGVFKVRTFEEYSNSFERTISCGGQLYQVGAEDLRGYQFWVAIAPPETV